MSLYVKDIDPELVEKGRLLIEKLLCLSDELCHYGVERYEMGRKTDTGGAWAFADIH